MHVSDDAPRLGSRTWQTAGGGILLVPLGSTEQHGPHLPLNTDTVIADALALELVVRCRRAGVAASAAPALPFGASGEHEGFAGTISIGVEALKRMLVELGRTASAWAQRTVFVNGHGGNVEAVRAAVGLLRDEGRDADWIPCAIPTTGRPPDAHSGWVETSLMLHLAPSDVRADRAEAGDRRTLAELMPVLRRRGVRGVSPNGVLGDPEGATADEGRRLFEAMCDAAWVALRVDTP